MSLSIGIITISNIKQRVLICDRLKDEHTVKTTTEDFSDRLVRMNIYYWIQLIIAFYVESVLSKEFLVVQLFQIS